VALLSAIVRWSLRNRAVVVVATVLFAVIGVRSLFELPIDAVPDLTNVQVQIITPAPALSPIEVEQYVTVPVERAVAGIPRTTQVRSVSKYGLSVVTIVFREDTDIYLARQLVAERMREAEEAVPSHYGSPEMGPISTGRDLPVYGPERPTLAHASGGDPRLADRPTASDCARHRRGK
jgi:cobalt-zinc-cadmium resistance protein CzcA